MRKVVVAAGIAVVLTTFVAPSPFQKTVFAQPPQTNCTGGRPECAGPPPGVPPVVPPACSIFGVPVPDWLCF